MEVREYQPPSESQESLSTKILVLPEPIFHGDSQGCYTDAMRTQAPLVVNLLNELHQSSIDRHENPVIATYDSRRVN